MPAMRSDGIARLCRYQCPTRAVLVVLIPTGLGRALRRHKCRLRWRHDRSEHRLHEARGTGADRKQRLPGSRTTFEGSQSWRTRRRPSRGHNRNLSSSARSS